MAETKQATPLIYGKMADILSDCGFIGKDRKNQQQGYSFRGIDDIYNELHGTFAKHRVFAATSVLGQVREERPTKAGGTMNYTILTMQFRFYAEDGSFVDVQTVGEASDSGDKSCNKAMSTALKYALFQVFLIPTEEEKDTEYQSPEFVARQNQQDDIAKRTNELATALIDVFKCSTVEELTALKNRLPDYIVNHKQFGEAGKEQYTRITAAQKEAK